MWRSFGGSTGTRIGQPNETGGGPCVSCFKQTMAAWERSSHRGDEPDQTLFFGVGPVCMIVLHVCGGCVI